MSDVIYIYALIDPRDNQCRYIGISKHPTKRLYQHISEAKRKKPNHKNNWVNLIYKLGLEIEQIIIEESTIHLYKEAERFWIAYFKTLGANLLNVSLGGDDCVASRLPKTEEHKRNIGLANLGREVPEHVKMKVRGNKNAMAKISEEDIPIILEMLKSKIMSKKSIAELYNISVTQVRNIQTGKHWMYNENINPPITTGTTFYCTVPISIAREIREEYKESHPSLRSLAKKYNLSAGSIRNVLTHYEYNIIFKEPPIPILSREEACVQSNIRRKGTTSPNKGVPRSMEYVLSRTALKVEEVVKIRKLHEEGCSIKDLMELFKVGRTTIRRVINKESPYNKGEFENA